MIWWRRFVRWLRETEPAPLDYEERESIRLMVSTDEPPPSNPDDLDDWLDELPVVDI